MNKDIRADVNLDVTNVAFDKISDDNSGLLKAFITLYKAKTIVEIGVAFGSTTKHLCEAAKETDGHVFGFDIWEPHYDFKLDYIQYESGYYTYDISFQDFEIGDTIETINNTANIYSCCGDILDKDYMRCPTCQEHC